MASFLAPKIYSYKTTAAILKGKAVKIGSTRDTVVVGAANTDRCIGLAQSESTAAGDIIEVAHAGGGGKALLGETVAAGIDLCAGADGRLVAVNAAGDEIIARTLEAGVAGQLVSVQIDHSSASAAQ